MNVVIMKHRGGDSLVLIESRNVNKAIKPDSSKFCAKIQSNLNRNKIEVREVFRVACFTALN